MNFNELVEVMEKKFYMSYCGIVQIAPAQLDFLLHQLMTGQIRVYKLDINTQEVTA